MLMRLLSPDRLRLFYYKEIYRKKILLTHPVVCDVNSDYEIHILTCKKDFLDAIWCLKTFYYYSNTRPNLIIHEDGTLNAGNIKTGLRHFPNCTIIRKTTADNDLQRFLEGFSYSQKNRQREDFYCALKLFDAFYYSQAERLLFLDSDILFFRNPTEIIENSKADRPFFNSDYQNAYSKPPGELAEMFGIEVAPKVNAGLMFLRKEHYGNNLEFIEHYFEKMDGITPKIDINRHEQTLNAILLSKYGALRLSQNYQISRKRAISDQTVSHHFVSDGSRVDFYRQGLKHLRAKGFLREFNKERTRASRDTIFIAAACDRDFAPPLTVMLRSLTEHLQYKQKVLVYVLTKELEYSVRKKIRKSLNHGYVHVKFLRVDDRLLSQLKISHHITVASYYRLLIPTVLPKKIEKVIYLDADMLINTDIRKLWDMDMGQNYVLAVQEQCKDAQYVSSKKALPSYKDLGINPDAKYFNSGVMLMNLKKWRTDNISERIIEYLHRYREKVLYWDQDGLNAVLAGKWGEIDHRWNLLSQTFMNPSWDDGPIKDRQTYERLISHPHIVHFNSPSKPWHVKNEHPYKNLFFHYLSMTKWAGWQPEETR